MKTVKTSQSVWTKYPPFDLSWSMSALRFLKPSSCVRTSRVPQHDLWPRAWHYFLPTIPDHPRHPLPAVVKSSWFQWTPCHMPILIGWSNAFRSQNIEEYQRWQWAYGAGLVLGQYRPALAQYQTSTKCLIDRPAWYSSLFFLDVCNQSHLFHWQFCRTILLPKTWAVLLILDLFIH